MKDKFRILIADRNPNIREFLRREMSAAGYHPCLAKDGQEILRKIEEEKPIDLLIVDLDLPGIKESAILAKIERKRPTMPVIIHTFLFDYTDVQQGILRHAAVVEKDANSIDRLKNTVSELLSKSSSNRERR
ncbi:MAG: response regulator [Deltaproteobacteria bacterium]|nr:response regulator [Deltaproteobacteria bacterium]MBW2064807.1 response regulator [Deltaproteobacteria bacterium]